MRRFLTAAVAAALSVGASAKCPKEKPCSSPYGDCGIGAFCLGGCDPLTSYSIESCVPQATCKSETYKWDDLDSTESNTKYLGDADEHDWTSSGKPLVSKGNLLLTMGRDTTGTLMSLNHYLWYGKVSAKLKSSRGQGVVTGFILMSDVKDEIDFEFIGADLENAQTNFYHQGITDYTNGENATVGDTFGEWNTYEIDWKPEAITWSINGKPVRTTKRDDTFNETSNQYSFPQTPSRVQLSLWPAGLPSNGKGTIEWAGGEIDWNHEDIQNNDYYYAMFDEVKVECYDPPKDAKVDGEKSYVYMDDKGLESSVEVTDRDTVIKSLLATGEDMDKDYPSGSATPSQSDVDVVPGMSGAGPGLNGQRGGGGGGGGGGSGGSDSDDYDSDDFSQGGKANSDSGAPAQGEQVLSGSLFAVTIAVLALVTV